MFKVDYGTGSIVMHQGDTGVIRVSAVRKNGDDWTENDRMLFTVRSQSGEIVLQRIYRLDDQYDLGDGTVLVEFHNDDTDEWDAGQYFTELRYDVSPIWSGTAPTARCVNALTAGVKMIEGSIVRTTIQSTLTIQGVLGNI